jgi:hypothetical protein
MSDVFEGPGWWLASDGKWYSPHLHHDESYRAAYAAPEERPATFSIGQSEEQPEIGDVVSTAMPAASVVTVSESLPTDSGVSESSPTEKPSSAGTPVSTVIARAEELRRRARSEQLRVDEEEMGPDGDTVEESAMVADDAKTELAEPDSDTDVEVDGGARRQPTGRARLEVAPTANTPRTAGVPRSLSNQSEGQKPAIGMRDESRIVSTDLVPVPRLDPSGPHPVDLYDRVVASVMFLSGVAMIVGTFMPWEVGPRMSSTGWDLGDGLATVVAGVLGSAAAGPIFVGYRHVIPKTIAIVAGLVATVVVGLSGLQAISDSSAANTTVGAGFWVVAISGVAMLLAALADRSPLD